MRKIRTWGDVSTVLEESGMPGLALMTGSEPAPLMRLIFQDVLHDHKVDPTNPRDVGFVLDLYPDVVRRVRSFERSLSRARTPKKEQPVSFKVIKRLLKLFFTPK